MLFPTDLMSRKEKYNTRKAGRIEKFNMYEIMTKSEFDQKDSSTQKMLLETWRDNYQNKEILKTMGISSNTLSKLLIDLDIPKKKRGGSRERTSTPIKVKTTPPKIEASNTLSESIKSQQENHKSVEIFPNPEGLSLQYSGIYNADQLAKIFTKLQLIVDDESCDFELSISLQEIKRRKQI
jgi:hypothetical protein